MNYSNQSYRTEARGLRSTDIAFHCVGEALIWSLQQQFGPAFTPEMQQAWIALYDAIQAEMMRAAEKRKLEA